MNTLSFSCVFFLILGLSTLLQTDVYGVGLDAAYPVGRSAIPTTANCGTVQLNLKLAQRDPNEQRTSPYGIASGDEPVQAKTADRLSPQEAENALGLRNLDRVRVQKWLNALGYESGGADGVFGARSRKAIASFQKDIGQEPTGYLDADLYKQLTDRVLRPSYRPSSPSKTSPPMTTAQKAVIVTYKVLERFHLDRPVMDAALAKRMLERFIETLDPNRDTFLQDDVDRLTRNPEKAALDLRRGNIEQHFTIFEVYRSRLKKRLQIAYAFLNEGFDFSVQETYELDRSARPWAKTEEELDELTRKRVKNDYLVLLLQGVGPKRASETLRERYQEFERRIYEIDASDITAAALNTLTRSIDEGTTYIAPISPGHESSSIVGITTASIIDDLPDFPGMRIAAIQIPEFYRDFSAESAGETNYRSVAADLGEILQDVSRKGIDGIILDLRGNVGGSFEEAINVAGLFIASGPVAQVRDSFGKLETVMDPDPAISYAGPLAVFVDHQSAAASEIVAATIQDYKRGIVLGERTCGRGTIQTVIDLNRYAPGDSEDLGDLSLTMAVVFTTSGHGIHVRGVEPDVIFPTERDNLLRREQTTTSRPWSHIDGLQTPDYGFLMDPDVLNRHRARVQRDSVYRTIKEEQLDSAQIGARAIVSLQEDRRRTEIVALERSFDKCAPAIKTLAEQLGVENCETIGEVIRRMWLREAATVLADCIRSGCYR